MKKVEVITPILNANDLVAQENRELLKNHHILAVNVMASPGAGKTSLILQTAKALAGKVRLGVIEGDVASQIDADKVALAEIPVVQINTGENVIWTLLPFKRLSRHCPFMKWIFSSLRMSGI